MTKQINLVKSARLYLVIMMRYATGVRPLAGLQYGGIQRDIACFNSVTM